MRATIDTITGKLADSRSRFLGLKPVRCVRTKVLGKAGLLALSSRPWLIYNYMEKYTTSLLSCQGLDQAAPLCIETCQNGLVGLSENFMKIMNIQTFGDLFHS
jgi:splicing factor 3B subunit 3